ncbi:hypothetical protein B0O99DRAFT_662465 [Bisporella sp. PMI_857]|nr:hypothetical protein B0O99DRAFT_662465 [Bisporella sp. PMI_857]
MLHRWKEKEKGEKMARPWHTGTSNSQNSEPPFAVQLSCVQCRRRKLKCDRMRPRCGRCVKLQDSCVYPGSRQKQPLNPSGENAALPAWDHLMSSIGDLASLPEGGIGVEQSSSLQPEDFVSNELIGLGSFEQFPSSQLMDDLMGIYFTKLHYAAPMLHRSRYTASVNFPPRMRPPMCLQYIVMALAATTTEIYRHLAAPYYQLARGYAESDEVTLQGQGEQFTTVAHAQCWALIANYEAQQTWFSRASTSLCRSIRIAQMLGLHQIDRSDQASPLTLAPAKDWSELEERRRTWWVIFCSDRFVYGTTGWPAIYTLLPASEEAFDTGVEERTCSLTTVLHQGNRSYSSFAGRVLAAHMFHRTLEHISQSFPDDSPQDIKNGPYWKRHRGIDNDLAAMLMFLPSNLQLPRSSWCQNAVFVNVNILTAVICFHRAALSKIRQLTLPEYLILQSRDRLLPAAEGILNIFRMITDLDTALKNPLMAFSAYIAALVFLEDFIRDQSHQSEDSLQFILHIMVTIGKTNAVVRSLAIQLAIDMKQGGFDLSVIEKVKQLHPVTAPVPLLTKRDPNSSNVLFCLQGNYSPLRTNPIPPHSEYAVSDEDILRAGVGILPFNTLRACEESENFMTTTQSTASLLDPLI